MTYEIIASGSDGNAVVINGEILIDCGVSMKKLRESGYIKGLKLVLLTHEHVDHFKPATALSLHRERPSLRWGCCEWMVPVLLSAGIGNRVIDIYETADNILDFYGEWYDYDYFVRIKAERILHDVPNCCYHISDWFSDDTVFYATDCCTLDSIYAKDYSLYMIEANHTRAEIEGRIAEKQSRGEFCYETRAARNHLSQEQAYDWLSKNAGPRSKVVFLHRHKEEEYK